MVRVAGDGVISRVAAGSMMDAAGTEQTGPRVEHHNITNSHNTRVLQL